MIQDGYPVSPPEHIGHKFCHSRALRKVDRDPRILRKGGVGVGKRTSSNISSVDKELTIELLASSLTLLLLKKELLSIVVRLDEKRLVQFPGARSSGAGFSLPSISQVKMWLQTLTRKNVFSNVVLHLDKKTLEDRMKKRKKVKNWV